MNSIVKNNEVYITGKVVLTIIIDTVLNPEITEHKAYFNCKNKLNKICEIIASRRFGKSKNEIYKEILNFKTKRQVKDFTNKVCYEYFTQDDLIKILEK